MTVTSGFFNSVNGDRRYNAEQMSAIFDGIINDGVFMNIGTSFGVKAGTENEIIVGVGRAWFNSAWIYNDTVLPITADISELVLDRYDAVVIEIDHTEPVRKADIKIVKGTPSSEPKYPEMIRTDYVNQYPLAYIRRKAGSNEIIQADIENKIGTSDCPYVTGILKIQTIDNIVAQWQGEWEEWSAQWDTWMVLWNQWFEEQKIETDQETSQWMSQMKSEFETWFNSLKLILDGDVAANLGNAVVELQERFSILASERAVYEEMQDSSGSDILDSNNNPIEGRTVMGGSGSDDEKEDFDPSGITPDMIGAASKTHATQHSTGGSDPITPENIGAAPKTHKHNWSDITDPPDTTVNWEDVQNKPKTFPPSSHTHTMDDITSGTGAMNIPGDLIVQGDISTVKGSLELVDTYPTLRLTKDGRVTVEIKAKKPSVTGFNNPGLVIEAEDISTGKYGEMYLIPVEPYSRMLYIRDDNGDGGYLSPVQSYAEMTSLGYTEEAVNALLGVDE